MLPTTAKDYAARINDYFNFIKGEFHFEKTQTKPPKKNDTELGEEKIWDRDAEPALLTGLILHLGFNSKQQFEAYERNGKYAGLVKQARLRIEREYEKKLHMQAPTGAIFALKSLGWNDRGDNNLSPVEMPKSISIVVVQSGPQLAGSEHEVIL